MPRKLASVQSIKYIRPIDGADNIETVGILGWECVSKKSEFKQGDICVYLEIDSMLPIEERYEFLRKSSFNSELNKFRLRTVKLRKQLSQGLALPISLFPEAQDLPEGTDLTDILGIEKYEPPVPAQIAGEVRSFSWPISKTDEVRIQQNDEYGFIEELTGKPYYISLKLDGTSCSFMIDPKDGEYHVCGRNYSYKRSQDHSFWRVSEKYNLEEKLRSLDQKVALQGEVVGPGIQKNKMGLKFADFYVFSVVDIGSGRKFHIDDSLALTSRLGLNFVPILESGDSFSYDSDVLLEMAKGKYARHFPEAKESQEREGIVIRSKCGSISFKAISNDFLLKGE